MGIFPLPDFPPLDEEHKELKEFWLPGNANILGKRHPGASQGGGGREFLLFHGCSLIPKALLGGFGNEGAEIGEKTPKLWNLELFPVEMGWEMGGMRILLHLHVGMRDLLG